MGAGDEGIKALGDESNGGVRVGMEMRKNMC
jgi:hypothetical protein